MRHRARVTFRKYGNLRFIGHRDLVRLFERMLRRAGVQLAFSEGFHPKAKLSFPLALAVGIEGACEILEVEFSQPVEEQPIEQLLQANSPEGMDILSVVPIAEGAPKAQPLAVEYQIMIPPDLTEQTSTAIGQFMQCETCLIQRSGRQAPIDARADIETLEISGDRLRIVQRVTRTASAQPREVLNLLHLEQLEQQGLWLTRTAIRWDGSNEKTTALS